ncbi:MAG: DUF4157 domain-containing protein, partial [Acidobacteriota bacterium]|nr:DUF4157 domain-containing protein [Acidobacteriota bacterium]
MTRPGAAKQTQHQQQPQAPAASSGGSFQPTSTCTEFFDLQREAGNRAVSEWLKAGMHTSMLERERPVLRVRNGPTPGPVTIQTKPLNSGSATPAEQQADDAAHEVTKRSETGGLARSLIVEDDAQSVQTGQMKKSEFLSQLRASTSGAAQEALAGTMWSSMGCPYIERWFGHYEGQSAQHVERAVQKYSPEARGASNARDYIPLVTSRLRHGIEQWRQTGEVPADMPEEFASGGMAGITAGGLIGGLVGGALSAIGGAVSSVGSMLFKEREGGAAEATDPEAVRAQLGSGRSLDGAAKSRMESAFGANFSSVRIHTDAKAHALSNKLNARAFTIGSEVAFGAGEYQPGTMVGDALIAHELAHVAQQQGGEAGAALPLQKGHGESSALEDDADTAAVGAVVGLWGRSKLAMSHIGTDAMPRLKSRLQLQRCGHTPVVRNPADIQREFDTVFQQITGSLPEGATRQQLSQDLSSLLLTYENEIHVAGNDAGRREQAQQNFHTNLERMRQTAPLQAQLSARYNIQFTARSTPVLQEGQIHELYRAWTSDELRQIDAALSRVPRNYLSNVQQIRRNAQELDATVGAGDSTPRPDAAASWEQGTHTLHIFNRFFAAPDYQRLGLLLHEIGHSTVDSPTPTSPADFASLPPLAWRQLSDWQTATTATLATSVGINQTQATELIAE